MSFVIGCLLCGIWGLGTYTGLVLQNYFKLQGEIQLIVGECVTRLTLLLY